MKLEGEQKEELTKIIVSLVLFIAAMICQWTFGLDRVIPGKYGWLLSFGVFFGIYLICGAEILKNAAVNITHGEVFDECFLMALASLGAFALGLYKGFSGMEPDGFEEGCAVVIFYCIGEFFQDLAVDRSRDSIIELMDIRPETALLVKDAAESVVSPEDVAVGDILRIRAGEKIPLDGVITSGEGVLDMMALTGESQPEAVRNGDVVLSGSICMSGGFDMQVSKEYGESTVAKILDMVEKASEKKTKTERFITRFAQIYTPVVVIACMLVAIVPSLITGQWSEWLYRALSFLVVSCPCALVISIPLSFFMGIGTASGNHILIKGSGYLEAMADADIFVCDKTGTLTQGRRKCIDDIADDPIRPEAADFVKNIKLAGGKVIMLSGDKKEIAEKVASELGITEFRSELLPQDKMQILEEIMAAKGEKDVVCYIGDGINDAPSLMRSDVGVSMGSIGTDAAVEASDIVLMQDDLRGITKVRQIAYRTLRIARENIIFSIAIKAAVLVLAALGITNMWFAVFADVGVALLAVLNALRVGIGNK